MCLMLRVDAITLEKTAAKSGAVVSGLKVVDMVPYRDNFHCQRSDEISVSFLYVKLARVDYILWEARNSALLEVQFLEYVDFYWSANLHLKMLTLVRSIKAFREELKSKQLSSAPSGDQKKSGKALDWKVSFKNETNFGLLLSAENNMFVYYW
ncbi:hypothetical protein ACJJTC_008619 [Scirpophaga incertulas]